jgi:hypothetical protein
MIRTAPPKKQESRGTDAFSSFSDERQQRNGYISPKTNEQAIQVEIPLSLDVILLSNLDKGNKNNSSGNKLSGNFPCDWSTKL